MLKQSGAAGGSCRPAAPALGPISADRGFPEASDLWEGSAVRSFLFLILTVLYHIKTNLCRREEPTEGVEGVCGC